MKIISYEYKEGAGEMSWDTQFEEESRSCENLFSWKFNDRLWYNTPVCLFPKT